MLYELQSRNSEKKKTHETRMPNEGNLEKCLVRGYKQIEICILSGISNIFFTALLKLRTT